MTARRSSIAVVGGGAAATLFLAHLFPPAGAGGTAQVDAPLDITVFERSGRFARGIAYGTARAEHLLNVRAGKISGLDHDPPHFVNWLRENGHPYGPADFVPRMIYGDYLAGLFDGAMKSAAVRGCRVSLKAEEIAQLPAADITVVATGNALPCSPDGHGDLPPGAGYYADPWEVDYESLAARGRRVAILGTGLSMVDAVLSLRESGFDGIITAISRRGLLPAPHREEDGAPWPPFMTGAPPETVLEAFRLVRAQAREAARLGRPWQGMIDSLRPATNRAWEGWDAGQRQKLTRLAPYWNIHRHRMAPRSFEIIEDMRRRGALRIRRDRIGRIGHADGLFKIEGTREIHAADAVINCLGYRAGASLPLAGAGIYALGPPLAGQLAETTAIPEIRAQAAAIVSAITSNSWG